MTDSAKAKCGGCNGDGFHWQVPDNFNPFRAGGWMTARVSRKATCGVCGGTGVAREEAGDD